MRILVAVLGMILIGASPVVAAAPAPPPAETAPSAVGSWGGPFIGASFIFEFSRSGAGLAGRYRSDKSNKWAPLQNVVATGDALRFSFESQPPSTFALKLAADGKSMTGTATFGPHAALPLTLKRIA